MNVSRETPAVPEVAERVFASRLDLAIEFSALLATVGVERGLIGPRETARLWERHLLNCAVLAELIPESAAVADVGSGAGLPGLVLAIRRADLSVTLIEPLLRRCTFLSEAVSALSLSNVEVRRGRAEEFAGSLQCDVVTSRAVAPLPRLLGWSVPLLRPDGLLLAMKGRSASEEIADARTELKRWGGRVEVVTIGESVLEEPTYVVRGSFTGQPKRDSKKSTKAGRRKHW